MTSHENDLYVDISLQEKSIGFQFLDITCLFVFLHLIIVRFRHFPEDWALNINAILLKKISYYLYF